ncbi:hypothetical protein PTSG_05203 [Salpingoeca rosetta]|uniref:Malectin domain-containing protein n=1 Tax=Salpingoeca rosetta (strain ATCC 50818 / BSB-021) TaxID=946362 RepID=F2UAT4_SALR5|nr:uncharacterized protein PTSG_05203 [Salpingoeca rosetta]EGD73500.1 hypothetical protein PTSG_05203 [Salpingoeca rosetta]|eukprot:XP_004993782.1 hypothetical protein PTSG_05203 [Salpingoeca rosetta]
MRRLFVLVGVLALAVLLCASELHLVHAHGDGGDDGEEEGRGGGGEGGSSSTCPSSIDPDDTVEVKSCSAGSAFIVTQGMFSTSNGDDYAIDATGACNHIDVQATSFDDFELNIKSGAEIDTIVFTGMTAVDDMYIFVDGDVSSKIEFPNLQSVDCLRIEAAVDVPLISFPSLKAATNIHLETKNDASLSVTIGSNTSHTFESASDVDMEIDGDMNLKLYGKCGSIGALNMDRSSGSGTAEFFHMREVADISRSSFECKTYWDGAFKFASSLLNSNCQVGVTTIVPSVAPWTSSTASAASTTTTTASMSTSMSPAALPNVPTDFIVGDDVYAVNAGDSNSYTDTEGRVWQPAGSYIQGSTFVQSINIANTNDDTLYQSEKYASTLRMNFPVTRNKWYRVFLHFADICECTDQPGERVFDIYIEGTLVESNVDLTDSVGWATATVKVFDVYAGDTNLDIDFTSSANNGKITSPSDHMDLTASTSASAPPTTSDAQESTTATTVSSTPPNQNINPQTSRSGSGSTDMTTIIVAVVAGAIGLIAGILLAVFVRRRKKRTRLSKTRTTPPVSMNPTYEECASDNDGLAGGKMNMAMFDYEYADPNECRTYEQPVVGHLAQLHKGSAWAENAYAMPASQPIQHAKANEYEVPVSSAAKHTAAASTTVYDMASPDTPAATAPEYDLASPHTTAATAPEYDLASPHTTAATAPEYDMGDEGTGDDAYATVAPPGCTYDNVVLSKTGEQRMQLNDADDFGFDA